MMKTLPGLIEYLWQQGYREHQGKVLGPDSRVVYGNLRTLPLDFESARFMEPEEVMEWLSTRGMEPEFWQDQGQAVVPLAFFGDDPEDGEVLEFLAVDASQDDLPVLLYQREGSLVPCNATLVELLDSLKGEAVEWEEEELEPPAPAVSRKAPVKGAQVDLTVGHVLLGEVTDVDENRALLDLGGGVMGMMMFHDLTPPQSPANLLAEGDRVRVRIKSFNAGMKRAAVEMADKLNLD
jgi:hypothetical protein